MNKRDGINEILQSLNQPPLDVADAVEDIYSATIIDSEIDIAKRKVLSQGWSFNEYSISLQPNTEGYIVIPQTYLSVDSETENIVVRDWKLFNLDDLTYIFDTAQEVTVIEDIPFDDLPFHIANYVIQMASLKSYINIIGYTDDVRIRTSELNEARIEAIRDDANKQDGNALNEASVSTVLDRSSL